MILKKGLSLLTLITLCACGGGSSSPGNNSGGTGNTGGTGSTVLEGSWIKPCGDADPSDPGVSYDVVTLTFTGSTFDSDIKNYSDSGCTTPLSIAPNPTANGTFQPGSQVTTTGGFSATKIDTHILEYNGAPFDIDEYGLFYIDGDTLYFDDNTGSLDGTSDSLRPDTLDFNRAYFRQ